MSPISNQAKHVGDIISAATISATLMTWLPPLASLLTIIWVTIRIYETRTAQKMFGKTRHKRTRLGD